MLPEFILVFVWCFNPEAPCKRVEFELENREVCMQMMSELYDRFEGESIYVSECIEIDYD